MTCFFPRVAWLPINGTVNPYTGDGRILLYKSPPGYVSGSGQHSGDFKRITVPCGQCIGCRLDKTASWALRCMHESHLHEFNCFITLTFNDDNLAPDFSLHKEDFVNFMKRLRKLYDYKYSTKIRFFHSGEYGDKNFRPHHHAILFGIDFPDKKYWKKSKSGADIYRSETLERLWPYGYSSVGNVTYQSCGYVARYCLKKITGKAGEEYYRGRIPPYITMSRRPGIGRDWIEKYWRDVYPNDFCVTADGHLKKPPRYYDELYNYIVLNLLDKESVTELDEIKARREQRGKELDAKRYDGYYDKMRRLEVQSIVKERKIESLKREL